MVIDRGRSAITRAGLLWAVGVVLVTAALGWQAVYELGIRDCRKNIHDLAIQCAGPLDAWVLPLTLVGASLLLIAGLVRLTR